MNIHTNGRKTVRFRPSAGSIGGSKRIFMVSTSSSSYDNYYIQGATIGAQSMSIRRALKRRASKGNPCCSFM